MKKTVNTILAFVCALSSYADWEPRGICHVWTGEGSLKNAQADMLLGDFYDYNRNSNGEFFTYSGIYKSDDVNVQTVRDLKALTKIRNTGANNPTNSPDVHGQFAYTLRELMHGRYGILKKYYKYPQKVAASHIYLAPIDITSLEKELAGSSAAKSDFIDNAISNNKKKNTAAQAYSNHVSWFGVFRGKVIAPRSMTFRFFGAADDAIAVRFNDELVLETGFFKPSLYRGNGLKDTGCNWGYTKTYQLEVAEGKHPDKKGYVIRKLKSTPFCNDCFNGVTGGKPVTVTEGKAYPIEIIIGNNGGATLYYLLTQEVTAGNDAPLHLFRTCDAAPTNPPSFKGYSEKHYHEQGPAYAADSDIWKIAGKPAKSKKAKNKFRKVN